MSALLRVYHVAQAVASLYTGLLSYTSIRKVQTYEKPTEKAAQYSNIAEQHLKTTRTTQGAGAVSVLTSTITSLYLLTSSSRSITPALLSVALAVGLTAAHTHISNYWRGKAKIPLPKSGDYNDAITTSNQMRRLLGQLAISWGVVAGWYAWRWIS